MQLNHLVLGLFILVAGIYYGNFYRSGPNGPQTVVIVGGGLAGLSSAIEAARRGSKVVLLDSEKRIGGNSAKATSGINGAPTERQKQKNIQDSEEEFLSDSLKSGDGLADEILAHTLVHKSREAIEFLEEFDMVLSNVNFLGGHTKPRTHRTEPPKEGRASNIGTEIMTKLHKYVSELPEVSILVESKFTDLILEQIDGRKVVKGVVYQTADGSTHEILAKAVIIASGGYAYDQEGFLREYLGASANLPTTSGSFADGTVLRVLAKKIDAQLIHMDKVQVHPTAFVAPSDPANRSKLLAAEALRGVGGLLVNTEGRRFTDELGRRDHTTEAIIKHAKIQHLNTDLIQYQVYLVLNDEGMDKFGRVPLSFYMSKGFFTKYENAQEFAEKVGMSPEIFLETLSQYNSFAEKGSDPFGKTIFPSTFNPSQPLYVAQVTPAIHYTMGGLKISAEAQVYNTKGDLIHGVFAAGEATGGVHGQNRLGGNSLLECVVFGRIAGEVAASL